MKRLVMLFVAAMIVVPFAGSPSITSAAEIGGYIDGIDYSNSLIHNSVIGWAYDPRNKPAAVQVDISIDGEFIGSSSVSLYRPDVANVFGISDYRGFKFPIPHGWFDGNRHEVRVYSVNIETGGRTELGGSPFILQKDDPGVTGFLDEVSVANPQNPETFVRGWAFDNADYDVSVPIVVFSGDFATGRFLGSGTATISRKDVNSVYRSGMNHGFAVPIDLSGFSSGESIHLSVYAIDRSVGELKRLGTSAYQVPFL